MAPLSPPPRGNVRARGPARKGSRARLVPPPDASRHRDFPRRLPDPSAALSPARTVPRPWRRPPQPRFPSRFASPAAASGDHRPDRDGDLRLPPDPRQDGPLGPGEFRRGGHRLLLRKSGGIASIDSGNGPWTGGAGRAPAGAPPDQGGPWPSVPRLRRPRGLVPARQSDMGWYPGGPASCPRGFGGLRRRTHGVLARPPSSTRKHDPKTAGNDRAGHHRRGGPRLERLHLHRLCDATGYGVHEPRGGRAVARRHVLFRLTGHRPLEDAQPL